MYKNCIIWLFLLAVFTSNFSGLFVYAGYEMNRDYITSNLCINRNKPQMHCQGKCYLMRKVKEAEQNENNKSAKTALDQLSISFCQNTHTPVFNAVQIPDDEEEAYPQYSYCYSSQYINNIFRPPKFNG
ncbi:hypothetical protein [Pedobacter sp. AJM]|uniref:hypothetical protein n=1 Tax=Pedobacter sp. AJM TaxID=2003629 RepID=UPI000B4BFD86|nr:hypothetical protein [Pedobacter sp. AJM]OWK68821.1 hypothetical protein CBW18_20335 [Pedobacter sp. AJM]